ncbi:peptidylprolyl isomerase [Corynebacterium sp.]|uniref:peptidylprolyl isomerase n=1 Tax=Corynebacterium sp. TaxID=1720 RepID=UPI0026DD1582|nr:peptidylprolyl isomerase [Corynebacterium sp.]MDO5031758.1 peptidylprolyl isomerase [Corynebacterium sp.]
MSNNQQRLDDSLSKLDRELKSRDRKEKARPLGVVAACLVVILALVGGIWFFSTRENTEDEKIQAEESSATPTTEATKPPMAEPLSGNRATPLPASVTCDYTDAGQAAKEVAKPNGKDVSAKGTVKVNFATNQGDIEMELDRAVAPCTVNAITDMVKAKYYDNSICHRMTSGGLNVLQCGDPTGTGTGGPGFQFANEYPTDETDEANQQMPLTYPKGSIAMANSGPDTNGSQFFINYEESQLPPLYTYFGKLTATGQQTLDKIAAKGVEGGTPDGAPAEEVRITSATVEN